MVIQIKSHNFTLPADREAMIQSKIGHVSQLGRFFENEAAAVEVTVEHGTQKRGPDFVRIQVAVNLPGHLFRAEAKDADFTTALDQVEARIQKQIARLKGKIFREKRHAVKAAELFPEIPMDEETPEVLRRKRYSDVRPLSEVEAIDRMNLIGHDFFLFENADTGRFSMIYRREGGGYGLVEPRLHGDPVE